MSQAEIQPETVEDIISSLEGKIVTYNDPYDLIVRLARAATRELDELYQEIQTLREELGL